MEELVIKDIFRYFLAFIVACFLVIACIFSKYPLLIGLIIIILLLINFRNLKSGWYIFLFSLSFSFIPEIMSKVNFVIPEVALFSLFFVWLIKNYNFDKIRKVDWLVVLFLIFSSISLIWVVINNFESFLNFNNVSYLSPVFWLRSLFILFEGGLVYFLISSFEIKKKDFIGKSVFALILGGVGAGLIAILQFVLSWKRSVAFIGGFNFLAMFLIALIPVALLSFIRTKNKFYLFSAIILFLGLFTTGSRAGFLGLFAGLLLLFILNFRKIKYRKIISLVLVVFLLFSFISFLFLFDYPLRFSYQRISSDFSLRMDAWKKSFNVFLENPLFGKGKGIFLKAKALSGDFKNLYEVNLEHSHNLYLQVLAQYGIFSFLVFVGLLIYLFFNINYKKIIEKENLLYQGFLAGLIALLIFGIFDYIFYSISIIFMFFIYLGFLNKFVENETRVQSN